MALRILLSYVVVNCQVTSDSLSSLRDSRKAKHFYCAAAESAQWKFIVHFLPARPFLKALFVLTREIFHCVNSAVAIRCNIRQ